VPLPCGGYSISSGSLSFSSVYQAAGPVLCNLTVTASHTTVSAGQLVELVASASSLASLTMPLGKFLCLHKLQAAEAVMFSLFPVVQLGHFTFWTSLSLSVSLSPKFGLRPKISQKVKSYFRLD